MLCLHHALAKRAQDPTDICIKICAHTRACSAPDKIMLLHCLHITYLWRTCELLFSMMLIAMRLLIVVTESGLLRSVHQTNIHRTKLFILCCTESCLWGYHARLSKAMCFHCLSCPAIYLLQRGVALGRSFSDPPRHQPGHILIGPEVAGLAGIFNSVLLLCLECSV
jgi:hypothetical protein